jgi:hypothetical protein
MNYKDWTTLKTAGKVAFKKVAADGINKEHIVLEKKQYNPDTGEESTVQNTMSLVDLESDKVQKIAEKAKLTTEIAEIGKMITQIKKV